MLTMTADAAKRRFGQVLKAARDDAVAITFHGKRRYVVISADVYEYLLEKSAAAEERRAAAAFEGAIRTFETDERAGVRALAKASKLLRALRPSR